jgi:hypothetical protein
MSLSEYLEERLEPAGVSLDELRELLIRLMNYGVLARAESQTERELYDRYVRIEELVREALSLYGIRTYHDVRFAYVRLYPPSSRMPGMDQAEDQAFGGSLRARLSQHEIALILVLRAQYDSALREGRIDERGYVAESLEAISLALKNWLNRSLPDKATERLRLLKRLRQLRLIEYHEDENLESGEAWLRIHPMIVDFVSADALEAARNPANAVAPGARDTQSTPHADQSTGQPAGGGEDVS